MDRFSELETFVAVAEEGGFNAGARRLGRSAPTVTRQVVALEARIGTRLFMRTTRQIALTEAGGRLFRDARRLPADVAAAEASARGAHEVPQGRLAVTAPVLFGRMHVAPLIRSFVVEHPHVTARTLFLDRVVNLIEEGLDVAVRIGDLPDSSLTAVRVGVVRSMVVASPGYVAAHGSPAEPAELAHHSVAVSGSGATVAWSFSRAGAAETVSLHPALVSNTIDVTIDAALGGWAITRVFSYQVAGAIAEGRLVELLPGSEDRTTPVYLVHAEGPLRSAKIRAFVDHAARALRAEAHRWVV
ncbi:MAG: LysR family transcriptional regulator [Pseudomonadota bacterium]